MNKKLMRMCGVILFPVFLYVLFMILTGGKLSAGAASLVISQSMIPVMLGLAMAVLMQCGLMDFSVGCRIIFACAIGKLGQMVLGFPGFVVGVIIGSMVGAVAIAMCYRYLRIPSMVVSMGFVLVAEVAGYSITKALNETSGMRYDASIVRVFSFPFNILWVVLAGVIFYFIIYHTEIGAHIAAVGDNELLASNMGVSPANTKTKAYLISGLFIVFAAFLQVGSVGIVSASTGMATMSMVFQPMMGVIIGTTLLPLWNNFPLMVVVGELCISIIFNGLLALGLSDSWQNVFLGLFMFAVLGISGNVPRVREMKRKQFVRKAGPSAYEQ